MTLKSFCHTIFSSSWSPPDFHLCFVLRPSFLSSNRLPCPSALLSLSPGYCMDPFTGPVPSTPRPIHSARRGIKYIAFLNSPPSLAKMKSKRALCGFSTFCCFMGILFHARFLTLSSRHAASQELPPPDVLPIPATRLDCFSPFRLQPHLVSSGKLFMPPAKGSSPHMKHWSWPGTTGSEDPTT